MFDERPSGDEKERGEKADCRADYDGRWFVLVHGSEEERRDGVCGRGELEEERRDDGAEEGREARAVGHGVAPFNAVANAAA